MPGPDTVTARTLYDKLWDTHCVADLDDGSSLLYIDLHLLHEVTSPQAFANLRRLGRKPWRTDAPHGPGNQHRRMA